MLPPPRGRKADCRYMVDHLHCARCLVFVVVILFISCTCKALFLGPDAGFLATEVHG